MMELEDYMNHPSIISEPMPLREVYAIRLMIYDRIKEMTPEERTAYYNDMFVETQKKYGFKKVKKFVISSLKCNI